MASSNAAKDLQSEQNSSSSKSPKDGALFDFSDDCNNDNDRTFFALFVRVFVNLDKFAICPKAPKVQS